MSQDTVTVIIPLPAKSAVPKIGTGAKGTTEHKFVVHKEWICFHSPFFSSAFNGKFEEGKTQTMTLVDVDPELFAIVAHWIYSKEVRNSQNERPDLAMCAKLWILVDRFLVRKMQNGIMREVHDEVHSHHVEQKGVGPFSEFCKIAVDFKQGENPLFEIALKKLVCTKQEDFISWAPELPQSMLLRVALALKTCECKLSDYHKPKEVKWEDDATKFFLEEWLEDGRMELEQNGSENCCEHNRNTCLAQYMENCRVSVKSRSGLLWFYSPLLLLTYHPDSLPQPLIL